MERIKLTLPAHFSFATTLTIRVTDLNYGGHVGNDTFLALMQEARQQFLLHHGYQELNFAGVGLIMADAAIEYKKELNYGDEIKMSVTAANFDKYSFDVYYKLEIINSDKLTLAGKGKTGMLCYDYEKKKMVSVPEGVKEKLGLAQ
jgi:YbgC/YbaW family acyl-CoA thioester hydrolase